MVPSWLQATPELVGIVALGVLWINTLLVAAATAQRLVDLNRRRRSWGLGGQGAEVVRGDGPGGELARHTIEQVGRLGAGRGAPVIRFHDRAYGDELFGGAVFLDGGEELSLAAGQPVEIWTTAAEQRAAACAAAAGWAEATAAAGKARGHLRTVAIPLAPPARIRFVPAGADQPLRLATFDPLPWLRRRILAGMGFIAIAITLAAACSALALAEPRFGAVSKVGAALGLGLFLGVQPAAAWLRDWLRPPHQAILRGEWREPRVAEEVRA